MKEFLSILWKPLLLVLGGAVFGVAVIGMMEMSNTQNTQHSYTDVGTETPFKVVRDVLSSKIGSSQVALNKQGGPPEASQVLPGGGGFGGNENYGGQAKKVIKKVSRDMIIYNRTITLKVTKIRESARDIERMVEEVSGYIASMNFGNEEAGIRDEGRGTRDEELAEVREGTLVVRIPVNSYKKFVAKVKGIGTLIDESENADEVSDQYVDLSARLRNLIREEERLLDIFSSAKNVRDMLAVENQLNRIRGEIESFTAQKKQLEQSVALATVTINLRKAMSLTEPQKASWGFDEAFRTAFGNFIAVIKGIIVFIGTVLPFAFSGAIIYGLYIGGKSLLAWYGQNR